MKVKPYERKKVLEYAKKWTYGRNPKYYNYDSVGGDCTNFASQCIYAGSGIMNYSKDTGWYYNSANNLNTYLYQNIRFIHIEGVRIW